MKKICIIGGAGHIGLPLALKFSEKNLVVNVIDKNKKNIDKLKNGFLPFKEEGGEKLFKKVLKNKKINFFTNYDSVRNSDYIILTVGTPLVRKTPSLSQIYDVLKSIKKFLKRSQSIILRSTVFPGATDEIQKKLFKLNKNIGLSYCPERVAQGKSIDEIQNLTQIVSSNNKKEEKKISNLFKVICNDVETCSYEEAEMIKLFSNAWRYIKFGIANEFYMLCEEKNLNFNNIYRLMKKNYPRNEGIPAQGFAAGPCLPKDAIQLHMADKQNSKLIKNSYQINNNLPMFLVKKLKKQIKIKNKKIGILGTSFKGEIDDERDSLSIKLSKILKKYKAIVLCHDPFVKNKSYKSLNEIKKSCDVIFIATPHKIYKNIKLKNKIVIDCWNLLRN